MHCTRTITDTLTYVGGSDRRLSLFEGAYPVPYGVRYNSYLLCDEKTVLFDTVDNAVQDVFLENVAHVLKGRALDYVIVQHMEPDHSASLAALLARYPDAQILCSQQAKVMIGRFFGADVAARAEAVKEGDTLSTGVHTLRFYAAPMVHWPEVLVTYDETDRILFSADAFGVFGAADGALFADEVDFARDYMDEARRYYTNIVGKYGPQVQALLKKAATLDIAMICPLHGFVLRRDFGFFLEKYDLWSRYEPEEKAVMIAYASIYGHTKNAAEILSFRLRERGVATYTYDVSAVHVSELVAAAFRCSHIVFAAPTYNMGIFTPMEHFLHDLAAHNMQNRAFSIVQNGSWAPVSGKLMCEVLQGCKNMTQIGSIVTVPSAVHEETAAELDALAAEIAASF
jgi:flavorubredoxin